MKKYALDIKSVMKAIDTKDYSWYNTLSEDTKKDVSVWQLMRFLSSVDSNNKDIVDFYLVFTNDLINVNFNEIRDHVELQIRLMQIVGIGSQQFHPWIAPGKKQKKDKIQEWLIRIFPQFNDDEIKLVQQTSSNDELMRLANDHGLTDKEIKEIFG